MWMYNLKRRLWREIKQSGLSPPAMLVGAGGCFIRAAAIGNKLVIIGREKRPDYTTLAKWFQSLQTTAWLFDVTSSTWSDLPDIRLTLMSTIHNYDNMVIGLGSYSKSNPARSGTVPLIALHPGCDAGLYSPYFTTQSCQVCSKGFFSAKGSHVCDSCPTGATTSSTGGKSVHNCTCKSGYCKNGDCTISFGDNGPQTVCSCHPGFTGGRCQYPTYYLISLGAVVISAVVTVFITVIVCMIKGNKKTKRELREFYKVWDIKEDEIHLLSRIDRDVPGGFGEVYRASYREMTVAVKKHPDVVLDEKRS